MQPAHHLFPALHHSKLKLITPLIRKHYPVREESVVYRAGEEPAFLNVGMVAFPHLP